MGHPLWQTIQEGDQQHSLGQQVHIISHPRHIYHEIIQEKDEDILLNTAILNNI